MKTCNQCGGELENDQAKFCSSCGADVTNQVDDAPEKVVVKDDDGGKVATEGGTGAERDITEPKNNMADDKVNPPQVENETGPEDALSQGKGDIHSKKDGTEHSEQNTPSDGEAPPEEGAEKYKEAVESAWQDGIVDEQDREELDTVRKELDLPESKAADLEQEARNSISSGRREQNATDMSVVDLEFNDNRFYMEKKGGVLFFRVVNKCDRRVRRAKVAISNPMLGRDEVESRKTSIAPHDERIFKIQVEPNTSGEVLLSLTISYAYEGEKRVYIAEPTFKVLDENLTPKNIKNFVFDQGVNIDSGGGDIGYGNSIRVRNQVKEDIQKGIVKTPNDLIKQNYPPNWQKIKLHPDEDFDWPPEPVPDLEKAGEKLDRACLNSGTLRTLFISSDTIKMGRKRQPNDIRLLVLPRNKENNCASQAISRTHLTLKLDKEGLKLINNATEGTRGSTLNGEKIDSDAQLSLKQPSDINVADALSLRITPFLSANEEAMRASRYKKLGKPDFLWGLARRHGLRAVKIERKGNLAERECYMIIYRWVNIGIGLYSDTLKPEVANKSQFRLLRLGDMFWLENIGDCTEVNDVTVDRGYAAPLASDMVIRAESAEAHFCKFFQCE